MCEGIRRSEASRWSRRIAWMASGSDWLPLCPRTRCRTAPAGKSSQVEQSKFDSFSVEGGVALDNLFYSCALLQHVGDQVDGNSRATIDGRAAHHLRVFDD